MSERDSVINIASDEIGYLEKSWAAYNENPDVIYDKTAGAGRDNVTKYAKEMDDLEVYNGPKNGYPWCKVFIDWCMVQALGLDRAGELLHGWTAGVTQAYNWFNANGQISNTPEVGALIIFGDCDHIGIVIDYDDSRVYTIEGNTSGTIGLVANGGSVAQKSYSRNSSYIKCYAIPEYEDEPGPTPPTPPTPGGDPVIVDIQRWVNSYGLDIAEDGEFGPETLWGLTCVYQIELNTQFYAGLDVDGIFGQDTYKHTPIVGYGAQGNITKCIQAVLYCKGYDTNGIDGLYYDGTAAAVTEFQADCGFTGDDLDGIFGPDTGIRLYN